MKEIFIETQPSESIRLSSCTHLLPTAFTYINYQFFIICPLSEGKTPKIIGKTERTDRKGRERGKRETPHAVRRSEEEHERQALQIDANKHTRTLVCALLTGRINVSLFSSMYLPPSLPHALFWSLLLSSPPGHLKREAEELGVLLVCLGRGSNTQ